MTREKLNGIDCNKCAYVNVKDKYKRRIDPFNCLKRSKLAVQPDKCSEYVAKCSICGENPIVGEDNMIRHYPKDYHRTGCFVKAIWNQHNKKEYVL